MIEVEKKFILNEEDKKRILTDSIFLNERVFTDIYYDTKLFTLTSQDKWLRSRDGKFELKLPLHSGSDRITDQYDELDDDKKISLALDLPIDVSLIDELVRAGYSPFCTCTTTRRKYKRGEFIIDIDTVTFQDFVYHIGEIELMMHKKSEINNAVQKIMDFAKSQNLTIAPVRGKVIEYLKRTDQKHYQSLVQAKVVKDF